MKYVRDHVRFPVSDEYFEQRRASGWRLRVIEWEKDELTDSAEAEPSAEVPPYGLEVVSGAIHLAQNPQEIGVLLTILEMIVRDRSVPLIANELNQRHYKTRSGSPWTAPAVFDLLPRVIEMGPTLLQSQEWRALRPSVTAQ